MNSEIKILVIDDEAAIRDLIARALTRAGHRVQVASAGEEGIKAALASQFDLILLDLTMPDIHGLEVCRALRNDPKTAQTPIIIVSGNLTEENRVQSLLAGAVDYIAKPFNLQRLLQTVATQTTDASKK